MRVLRHNPHRGRHTEATQWRHPEANPTHMDAQRLKLFLFFSSLHPFPFRRWSLAHIDTPQLCVRWTCFYISLTLTQTKAPTHLRHRWAPALTAICEVIGNIAKSITHDELVYRLSLFVFQFTKFSVLCMYVLWEKLDAPPRGFHSPLSPCTTLVLTL